MLHGGGGSGDPVEDFLLADGDLAIFCDAVPTLGADGGRPPHPRRGGTSGSYPYHLRTRPSRTPPDDDGSSSSPASKKRGFLPPPDAIIPSIVERLGNAGMILLLLETPSGFALFDFIGVYLYYPPAMEISFLREFQTFDDKSSAIDPCTGVVHEKIKNMILKYRSPGQKLAVGKHDYKTIIEATLGIPCLFDKRVVEAMWGMKHQMRRLVPHEKSELTLEERLPQSYGLTSFLFCHGFPDVRQEMIDERIVVTASELFDSETRLMCQHDHLRRLSSIIKKVSGFDTRDWPLPKLATALKVITCTLGEEFDYYPGMFAEGEQSKLVEDAQEYAGELRKSLYESARGKILRACQVWHSRKLLLRKLLMEAREKMLMEAKEKRRVQQGIKNLVIA